MEPGSRPATGNRIAIEIQYDGTNFNGWQFQNGGRTVQGEIEGALQVLLREKIRVVAAGRTDSGVHALGQVAHFNLPADIGLQRLCIGLNGILPRDVAVRNAFQVADDFHARFSAVERTYQYVIYNHHSRSPFAMHRAMWVRQRLDCDYLRSAAGLLVGEMDFSSFCKKRESKHVNTVRRIVSIDIVKDGDLIRLVITGNAFLHNMVRIIVGTLVEMNTSSADPGLIAEIIAKQDRDSSGITAPPYGLYLLKIAYNPALSTYQSAF